MTASKFSRRRAGSPHVIPGWAVILVDWASPANRASPAHVIGPQVTTQTGFHNAGRNWSWLLTRVVARRALTMSALSVCCISPISLQEKKIINWTKQKILQWNYTCTFPQIIVSFYSTEMLILQLWNTKKQMVSHFLKKPALTTLLPPVYTDSALKCYKYLKQRIILKIFIRKLVDTHLPRSSKAIFNISYPSLVGFCVS